jgi:nucleoside phosphorylase
MAQILRPHNRDGFEIAIFCALPVERDAVEALLDEEYETDGFSYGKAVGDRNAYTTGRLGNQHVVLAYMPGMGTIRAAAVAANLCSSFEEIKVGIVVGICGGVPTTADGGEIVLGDVIISTSVIQIDFGRQYPNKFIRKKEVEDTLGRANPDIRSFIGKMSGYLVQRRLKDKTSLFSAQICAKEGFCKSAYPGPGHDILYPAEYRHKHQIPGSCICDDCKNQDDDICESALRSSCEELGCDNTLSKKRSRIQRAMGFAPGGNPMMAADIQEAQKPSIHFGRMACSNQVMKSGQHRDRIAAEEGVIGFEMESAGTWDFIPTIVIKSVCDYADTHKNKQWQEYAAATAAACTKAMLEEWRGVDRPGRNPVDREHLG